MRFSINSLVRLLALLGLVSGSIAVAVARLEPPEWHWRLASAPHYGVINGFVLNAWPGDPGLLDSETGALARLKLPKGDRLEYGSCSPWSDESGESQVVGRWVQRAKGGMLETEETSLAFGIARYSLPSGRVLNRFKVETMPATHPCWFPDMSARLIYPGGDGSLYVVDFDRTDREGLGEDPVPQRVSWRCSQPGDKLIVRDPVWSADPRLGGRLIVSLQYREGGPGSDLNAGELWWLALSANGTQIVSAGPLSTGTGEKPDCERRYPNVARTPDGGLSLAFLDRPRGQPHWSLRIVPIESQADGSPTARLGEARTLTSDHLSALAPFSADGRWIHGIVADSQFGKLVRFPTGEVKAAE